MGLDRLAAEKRKEREEKESSSSASFVKRQQQQQRSYRNQRNINETPSHPGGINREALNRTQRQQQEQQQRHRGQSYKDNNNNDRRRRRYDDDDNDNDNDKDDRNKRPRRDRDDYDDDRGSNSKRRGSSYDDDNRDNRSRDSRRDDRRDRGGERGGNERDNYRRNAHDDYRRSNNNNGRDSSNYRRPQHSNNMHNNRDGRNSQRRDDRGDMPPPASRAPPAVSSITPSTNASTSTMRQRRNESVYAATPMSRAAGNNGNRRNDNSNMRTSRSDWDAETPLQGPRDNDIDDGIDPNRPVPEDDDGEFDRHFYLDEDDDGNYIVDQSGGQDMGRFLFNNSKTKAREEEMEKKRQQRYNPRKSALQDDQEAWEENRLLSSGAAVRSSVDLDTMNSDQDMSRVTLLVHQVKPPFLDGRVSFSTIREAVPTVRDASSDFAKMAREGSATLRYLRANKDKNTMRQKFWELGGTRMGDAVGVKKEEGKDGEENGPDETNASGELDYKKSSGFAQHVKKKGDEANAPVSNFARTKSIRQQREFLPVFSVREELLNVIRENTCVVIVGETGKHRIIVIIVDGFYLPLLCCCTHNTCSYYSLPQDLEKQLS